MVHFIGNLPSRCRGLPTSAISGVWSCVTHAMHRLLGNFASATRWDKL